MFRLHDALIMLYPLHSVSIWRTGMCVPQYFRVLGIFMELCDCELGWYDQFTVLIVLVDMYCYVLPCFCQECFNIVFAFFSIVSRLDIIIVDIVYFHRLRFYHRLQSTRSLPAIPIWLGIQHNVILAAWEITSIEIMCGSFVRPCFNAGRTLAS